MLQLLCDYAITLYEELYSFIDFYINYYHI